MMNLNNIKPATVQHYMEFVYIRKIKLIPGRRHCDEALVRPPVEHKSQHCSDCAIFTTMDIQCHATLQTAR